MKTQATIVLKTQSTTVLNITKWRSFEASKSEQSVAKLSSNSNWTSHEKDNNNSKKEVKKKRRDLQTGNSVGQMLRVKKKATCKQTSLKIEGKKMVLGQCGCGTVGRAVASVTIGPVFKSSVKCFGKMKIKKRGQVWPIFGHRPKAIGITI